MKIATKAYPYEVGTFDSVNLPKQLRESLVALKLPKVDIFYLHAPEYDTPLEVTLKAVNDLYKEGLFERVRLQQKKNEGRKKNHAIAWG